MTVYGEQLLTKFGKKHADARKPLARFIATVRDSTWVHLIAVKETFSDADYAPESGSTIFNIAGNRYRLVALVNFKAQSFAVTHVLTHEDYSREKF